MYVFGISFLFVYEGIIKDLQIIIKVDDLQDAKKRERQREKKKQFFFHHSIPFGFISARI